jgi:8-amino-3,8-dideoxy-alpha-D-manno-octulosonate transaminase
MSLLAIQGGNPVRTSPLPKPYLGTSVIGQEEMDLLTEVVQKRLPFRDYGDGTPHMVNDFEQLAREYFGMPYALATATGSGAFYCAMAGIGVGPGDEVIIPSFCWYTDFEAPVLLGATPVFADVDYSLNMDPDDFERKITPRTKAVIVVHFQGATNDMARFLKIAARHHIIVIEDCAQACGATYQGQKVGSLGQVSCFSFQQNKIMSTGDGGLLLTRDVKVFERAARFHDLGLVRNGLKLQMDNHTREEPMCGCQFRMNEFTGAVALAQLRKLDRAILDITRRHYWQVRNQISSECPGIKFRQVGDPMGDAGIALYLEMETSDQAKWFGEALTAEGIRVGPSSSCSNMLNNALIQSKKQAHPALPPFGPGWPGEKIQYHADLCPNTDRIMSQMVCVAFVPSYTDQDAQSIAEAIIKVWKYLPEHHGKKPRVAEYTVGAGK